MFGSPAFRHIPVYEAIEMIEAILYKELGELTKNKDRWKERIPYRLRKVRFHLPGRGDRNDRRPSGLDEEQMPQVLRLHKPLPGLGDPVREKDSLPRAVRQSGIEVKSGKTCPTEARTNRKR